MSSMMKRWELTALGRVNLQLAEASTPTPGPRDLLVRVGAVSLNYRDKLVLENGLGLQLDLPAVPGSDMAGTVVAVGQDVSRFVPGDRVMGAFAAGWIDGPPPLSDGYLPTLGGQYAGVLAQYILLPEDWAVASPASLSDSEASTLPIAGLTAWTALVELGSLRPGMSVLVQGTGGVALFAVQIAAAAGARVIVTSSDDAKLDRAKALGAADGINRKTTPDWAAAARALTDGRGVDHVLEIVGGDNLGRSLAALAPGGRISLIGVLDGFEASFPLVAAFLRHAVIQGVFVGHRRGLENLAQAVDRIALKPVIDAEYALADLPAALDRLDRGPFGKVVIRMNA
jgi:NADPH:quinone reductase-like Zn-dependent oxidoreductase